MALTMLDDPVAAVEKACVAAADELLRRTGFCPEPQVHLFVDEWDQPYVGYVRTRPYRSGADAVAAITTLGLAAAAATATRILLVWEEADLRASLDAPGDHPNGVACVIASIVGGHVLHWYPFRLHLGAAPAGSGGPPSAHPGWGRPVSVHDGDLPPVMLELLDRWRGGQPDPHEVFTRLDREGYPVKFVQR